MAFPKGPHQVHSVSLCLPDTIRGQPCLQAPSAAKLPFGVCELIISSKRLCKMMYNGILPLNQFLLVRR